jgi:hypothetical protein
MSDDLAFALMVGVAAICGALAGRIFALEGEDRRTSILAAAYCGAGAGLLGAPLFAFALVLANGLFNQLAVASILARAAAATGPALLWGAPAGAVGGLVVGVLVALFKRYAPP